MTQKFLTTTVIPLFLATATASVAQTDMSGIGDSWNDGTETVFFTNDGSMTLRPRADIETRWHALPETERALIVADCVAVQDANAMTTGTAADGTTQNNASTYGEATAPVGEDTPEMAPDTTGDTAIGTVSTNPSTFGSAETGTDSSGTAATATNAPDAVEADPTANGTGNTNSSTFGSAATGTGLDQVTDETWVELCTVVADL